MAGQITMDELLRAFGRPMAPVQNVQDAPVGLLASPQAPAPQMPQQSPQQEPAKRGGLFGFLADPDARARLAIALEGMTMNPNQAYMQSLQEGVKTRKETKAATEAKNKTAAWLRSQGREDLAAAIEAGVMSGSDAASLAMTPAQANVPAGVAELQWRAEQAGLTPGTPEYQAFIMGGGKGPLVDFTGANIGGASEVGTIPQGYELFVDPATGARSMRPIPGGPEDTSKQTQKQAGAAEIAGGTIISAAQRAREAAQGPTATGLTGAALSYIPTSQAAEVYRQVDVLKSQAKVENLTAMRAASPTGGALGSVTEKEAEMLAAKSGALDPKSPNFMRDLDDYELTLLQTIHGPEAGKAIFDQSRNGAPISSVGGAPMQINSDSEYDALPSGAEFVGPDGLKRRKP